MLRIGRHSEYLLVIYEIYKIDNWRDGNKLLRVTANT